MSVLQFVSSTVWKSLFGKAADSLERSIDHADEFMIVDYEPVTSTYVSVPPDLGQLSPPRRPVLRVRVGRPQHHVAERARRRPWVCACAVSEVRIVNREGQR